MFTVTLDRLRTLSASTRDFRFTREDGETTRYEPGQFFRFVFEDAEGEFDRSYSLCNFEELYSEHLDLVISRVDGGRATRLLFDCEVGLRARVTGPFGRLTLPATLPRRLFLIATSVGLSPFMPILKALETGLNEAGDCQVVLLLGVRDRSEFIYGKQLLDYGQRNPWFELRLCLSREPASAGHERDGYVTAQLAEFDPDTTTDHFLLCGNPAMVDEAYARLKVSGFGPRQVIREKYVFAREKKAASKLSDEQKKLIAEKMKKYT
ncbi:MAG: FAD-binding oxidoreductase [Proteobacteria bacterium]|nr:FAD-binding oxidoreductase [Pseudomonadota bacterium]